MLKTQQRATDVLIQVDLVIYVRKDSATNANFMLIMETHL